MNHNYPPHDHQPHRHSNHHPHPQHHGHQRPPPQRPPGHEVPQKWQFIQNVGRSHDPQRCSKNGSLRWKYRARKSSSRFSRPQRPESQNAPHPMASTRGNGSPGS